MSLLLRFESVVSCVLCCESVVNPVFFIATLMCILFYVTHPFVYPVFYVAMCSKTKLCDKSRKI